MKYGKMKAPPRITAWMGMAVAVLLTIQGISAEAALKATPDHVDFGAVNEGDPVVAVAEIINIGDTPVEITNVRTS